VLRERLSRQGRMWRTRGRRRGRALRRNQRIGLPSLADAAMMAEVAVQPSPGVAS
jgi:hypothetical protein